MIKEISCGFILYNNCLKPRFLLLKKSDTPEWDFPKGHHEFSETHYETAQRELYEETKLNTKEDILIFRYKNKVQHFTYEYKNSLGKLRKIILFVALCNKNPTLSLEHDEFAWVTFQEAKLRLKYPEVCQCLQNIYKLILDSNKLLASE